MAAAPAAPAEHLLQSRERLRAALQAAAAASSAEPGRASSGAPAAAPALGAALLATLLRQWWEKHPAHQAATLAAQTARELTLPVAQKHPVALVGGAFVVGAGLIALRPWRLLSGAALLSRLAPTLLRMAWQRPSK